MYMYLGSTDTHMYMYLGSTDTHMYMKKGKELVLFPIGTMCKLIWLCFLHLLQNSITSLVVVFLNGPFRPLFLFIFAISILVLYK